MSPFELPVWAQLWNVNKLLRFKSEVFHKPSGLFFFVFFFPSHSSTRPQPLLVGHAKGAVTWSRWLRDTRGPQLDTPTRQAASRTRSSCYGNPSDSPPSPSWVHIPFGFGLRPPLVPNCSRALRDKSEAARLVAIVPTGWERKKRW